MSGGADEPDGEPAPEDAAGGPEERKPAEPRPRDRTAQRPPEATPRPEPGAPSKPQPQRTFSLKREQLERESQLSFVRGSGPGGQHRNKVETGVRLVHEPSGIVITATDHRSQMRNREAAFERLIEKLAARNQRPKKRKRTRKPRSADRKRLNEKRKRSETKQRRRSKDED